MIFFYELFRHFILFYLSLLFFFIRFPNVFLSCVLLSGREQACNLSDIKVIKQLGGTVEDTELVEGIVFPQKCANVSGPKRIEKAKIGFIQFCISPPKTDMDHNVIVSDYAAMDRVLKEERTYILNIVKQIKKAGCNVLLVCENSSAFIYVY